MGLPTQMEIYILVQLRLEANAGHAMNKILKDIILRYHILQGRRVEYIPGWDCHGLPIELKAVKSTGKFLPALTIRGIARRFAEKTVLTQMQEFRGWAVLGDWDGWWCTMGITSTLWLTRSRV